jgi:hypothetical protein
VIRIYVSGKYTGDEQNNTLIAIAAGDRLATANAGICPFVPHGAYHWWNMIHEHGWQFWMSLCLEEVRRSDALLVLPASEASTGTGLEKHEAEKRDLPIFYDEQKAIQWARELYEDAIPIPERDFFVRAGSI